MTQSSGSRMFSSIVLTVFASILIVQLSDAFHVSHTRTSMKVSRSAVVKMSDNKAESSSGDDENSFMDILSGKAAVRSAKKTNPSLFTSNSKVSDRSKLSSTLSASGVSAVAAFKKLNPTPRAGGGFDLADADLAKQFNALAAVLKTDEAALAVVLTTPDVLAVPFEKYAANFAVFEGKWGFEKALGVITRNPGLFSIPTTGYGSCEVAGDDAVALSYVIAATRPAGGILLTLLFLALLKPLVIGLIH